MQTTYQEQIAAINRVREFIASMPGLLQLEKNDMVAVQLKAIMDSDTALADAANTVFGHGIQELVPETSKSVLIGEQNHTVTLAGNDASGMDPDLKDALERYVEKPKRLPILHVEGMQLRADLMHDHRKLYDLLLDLSKKATVRISQSHRYKMKYKYSLEVGTETFLGNTFWELYDRAKDLNDISEKKQ